MYKLKNDDYDKLKNLFDVLPRGDEFKKLSIEEQNTIISAEEVMIRLIKQKRDTNRKIADYIADKRKVDKNYARTKKEI